MSCSTMQYYWRCFIARMARLVYMKTLSAEEFILRDIPTNKSLVLDVRTQEEWDEGHLDIAIHIDYFSPTFYKKIQELDKNKTYYIYCRAGRRSAGAICFMYYYNIKHCVNITDGMIGLQNCVIQNHSKDIS